MPPPLAWRCALSLLLPPPPPPRTKWTRRVPHPVRSSRSCCRPRGAAHPRSRKPGATRGSFSAHCVNSPRLLLSRTSGCVSGLYLGAAGEPASEQGGRTTGLQTAERVRRETRGGAPPPAPPRTKWTRRVPHPVLIGHAASAARRAEERGCGARAPEHRLAPRALPEGAVPAVDKVARVQRADVEVAARRLRLAPGLLAPRPASQPWEDHDAA